jgi:hypothetical protein
MLKTCTKLENGLRNVQETCKNLAKYLSNMAVDATVEKDLDGVNIWYYMLPISFTKLT